MIPRLFQYQMRQRGDYEWKVCEDWEADCCDLSEGTIPVPAYKVKTPQLLVHN